MSRIRSVHPGLFTDEAFVTLSPAAQVFWIGLWCEADDQGAFEWKPLTLKMRILPASGQPVEPLLEELAAAGCVQRYPVEGRWYGIVRNFVKHQRPKTPKNTHPVPEELRNYAGFNDDGTRPDATTGRKRFASSSEPLPNEFGSSSEIGSQMEDGGGRSRTEASASNEAPASAANPVEPEPAPQPTAEERYWAIADLLEGRGVARSRMGQLQAAHNGNYRTLIPLAESILNSREPGGYLGKVLAGLREAEGKRVAPRRRTAEPDEPDFVRSARAEGQPVVVGTRKNGRPKFTIGREDFDETGQLIGF